MNGRSSKALRHLARDASQQTAAAITPGVEAAIGNEQKTRYRVQELEARAEHLGEWAARHDRRLTILEHREHQLIAWNHRPFLGRLAWLLFGS